MDAMQHILAAVDFTPDSEKALSLATRLARVHDALLHITHVVEDDAVKDKTRQAQIEWEDAAGTLTKEAQGEIRTLFKTSQRFQRLMADGTPLPVKMLIDVPAGKRFEEVFRRTRDIPADLIILGGNENIDLTPEKHSFVLNALARMPAPVLLAWNTEGEPFMNILVAVGSDIAAVEPALTMAGRLAHFDEAALHFVHVEQTAYDVHFAAPAGAKAVDVEQRQREFAAALKDKFAHLTHGQAATPQVHFPAAAEPAQGIIEIAQEIEADLIILTRGGRRTQQRLGPTTRAVIDDTECSILIVKEPGFAYDLD